MKLTTLRLAYLAALILAFVLGITFDHYRSQHELTECRALNESLADDLTRAVGRGVSLEASLTLCKEQKKSDASSH